VTRRRDFALGVAGLAVLVTVVEALPRLGLVDRRFLPPFSEMADALVDEAAPPISGRRWARRCAAGRSAWRSRWPPGSSPVW
jgi:ABC-type nitrate/sulfonate/bicarbonate transport system permease component